ncbi:MAG: hypothetical protein AAFP90_13435, partial [Planctomycetota bacterium]
MSQNDESSFLNRMQSAVERGRQRGNQKAQQQRQKEVSEEEMRRLHTQYRLSLSGKIEAAIQQVANHFPGFRTEILFGETGWGAACYR